MNRIYRSVIALALLALGALKSPAQNVEVLKSVGAPPLDKVAVIGNRECVSQGADVLVLDVTNSTQPIELGRVTLPATIQAIANAGNLAYVAEGTSGLFIIDFSNPQAPSVTGSYDTPGNAFGVAV